MFRAFLIVVVLCAPAIADDDDDTLRFYLSKSALVVSGEIVDEPRGSISETGVVNYSFKLKVSKLLKGKIANGELNIELSHFGLGGPESPLCLKKDAKVILFLKRGWNRPEYHSWRSADGWFGIQQFNTVLEHSLLQIAEENNLDEHSRPKQ